MNIRDRILARADLASALDRRDLDELAAGLNTDPPLTRVETWVDALGIINRCASGKSILRKLKAGAGLDAVIEVAWERLVRGQGLDFGAASTQDSIEEMRPVLGFTDDEMVELRGLGLQPVLVDRWEVEAAMFNTNEAAQ